MGGRASPEPSRQPAWDDDDDVRVELIEAEPLDRFLRRTRALSKQDRLRLVEQAALLLEGLYVHLPLKRAMYAVDPVRRLRLLERRLTKSDEPIEDLWFHREMIDIFTSVRDLHTVYLMPEPFDRAVAFLPFQVEDYFEDDVRRYMVSKLLLGLDRSKLPASFQPGVEITHWNGVPMPRAIELVGTRNAGNNPEARRARGLGRLTVRWLAKSAPPDEEWVRVTYRCEGNGAICDLQVPWSVALLPEEETAPPDGVRLELKLGLDPETSIIHAIRKRMFRPDIIRKQRARAGRGNRPTHAPDPEETDKSIVATELPGLFHARKQVVEGTAYGYIRIRSFQFSDSDKFLDEFVRLVEAMPANGLIVDVRDNPGGHIESGERLLQVLTPKPIQPEPMQFLSSPLSLRVCQAYGPFESWADSVERAMQTGAVFSAGFPVTDVDLCNDRGQRYYGPVVLITNALCYSTTDIFAAGFQDHEIGTVLGTDRSTGAGGANVVMYSDLRRMGTEGGEQPNWPFEVELPGKAGLRVALRRSLRVGKRAGMELEDIGVTPEYQYPMQREDVLDGNRGLVEKAAKLLATKPSYDLRETPEVTASDQTVTIEVRTRNIDRIDPSVDGWASASVRVKDGEHTIAAALPPSGKATCLQLQGYRKGGLVAARKIPLAEIIARLSR